MKFLHWFRKTPVDIAFRAWPGDEWVDSAERAFEQAAVGVLFHLPTEEVELPLASGDVAIARTTFRVPALPLVRFYAFSAIAWFKHEVHGSALHEALVPADSSVFEGRDAIEATWGAA